MCYLGILGKRFGDAGLQDILIESEVVAPGSINGVISGHHYNRSMRAHKLLYESLQRVRFITFLDSLPPEERDECMDVINEIKCAFPDRTIDVLCANEKFDKMCSKYADFVKRRGAENPTFAIWSSYINMVHILLLFVRATRESDWQLHLSTVRLMMAWFFAICPSHIHLATVSSVLKASGLSNVKVSMDLPRLLVTKLLSKHATEIPRPRAVGQG